MKKGMIVVLVIMLLTISAGAGSAEKDGSRVFSFASDNTWDAIAPGGEVVGKAHFVCLNEMKRGACPAGAKNYFCQSPGWDADLSSIPQAGWIWGFREVLGDPVEGLAAVTFRKIIELPGDPVMGILWIAVDDSASVLVNGRLAGTLGSIIDVKEASRAQGMLKMIDIRPFLKAGANEIVVSAQNGPAYFSGGLGYGQGGDDRLEGYQEPGVREHGYVMSESVNQHPRGEPASARNPAGVVFGGWIIVGP
jgi:hypothetical protein